MKTIRRLVASIFSVVLFAGLSAASFGADLPRNSLYQLDVILTDQDGHQTHWPDAPAGPRIVGVFYSHCDYVCPMLFEGIKNLELQLDLTQRQRLQVGLITVDPKRDDVTTLKKTADLRAGDQKRWRLYRAQPADTRKIASLLRVQFRELSSGEFNHSSVMILLDSTGVELARTDHIIKTDEAFLAAVKNAIEKPTGRP